MKSIFQNSLPAVRETEWSPNRLPLLRGQRDTRLSNETRKKVRAILRQFEGLSGNDFRYEEFSDEKWADDVLKTIFASSNAL